MAQHPPPTIDTGLCLVSQRITHASVGHVAMITCALDDATSLGAQVAANRWQTQFDNYITPQLDNQCSTVPCYVVRGNGSTTPTVAVAAGAPGTGGRAITSPTPQVSLLVKKQTAVGGRKNRGRMFVPWAFATGELTEEGTITSPPVSTLQAAFSNFLTAMNTVQALHWVIANKTLVEDPVTHKMYPTAITMGEPVLSVLVERSVATQRRRMVRL